MRRLRARLGTTVSLWTAGELGADAAGLTVSSHLVVAGAPGRVVGALDPDSDLLARVRETGRVVVQLLTWAERDLAEMFGGTMPAPGGPFAHGSFTRSAHGPRLAGATTWAACRLDEEHELGWSQLVTVQIEEVVIGDGAWLVHRGGRFSHA